MLFSALSCPMISTLYFRCSRRCLVPGYPCGTFCVPALSCPRISTLYFRCSGVVLSLDIPVVLLMSSVLSCPRISRRTFSVPCMILSQNITVLILIPRSWRGLVQEYPVVLSVLPAWSYPRLFPLYFRCSRV